MRYVSVHHAARGTLFVLLFVWMFSGVLPLWEHASFPPRVPNARAATVPSYVGGAEASGNSADYDVSLTSLSGGSDNAPSEGDLVIVSTGFRGTANGDPGVGTAGYTEVADLYANDNNDANFSVNWKIMGAVPDTSISCNGSGSASNGAVCVVHVWRSVDPDTPMDVADVETTGTGSPVPDSGSITPVTEGAIVIATGLGAGASGDTSVMAPSGFSNQVDISVDPGSAAVVGISSMAWSGSGAVDPAAWTNWTQGTASANSWAAVTLALRGIAVPNAPTLLPDDGGSNQVAFNHVRQNDTTPLFRASATYASTFNRFQVEMNTASDFSGTAYTETFSGTYSSATAYNLQTTGSLNLPSTNGMTYYVRARASADGGSSYGPWSSETWTYTYTSTAGDAEWFQTTDAQFETGTLSSTQPSGSGSVEIGAQSATYVRANATAGSLSTTLDIGTAGTNRLVVVYAMSEADSATTLSGVTVDGHDCAAVQQALNPDGLANRTELWYCDESDLGASNGSVTVAVNGSGVTAANWSIHAQLFTGMAQSGPTDSGADTDSVTPTQTTTVTGIDVPAGGLITMGISNGTQGLSVNGWTSPLTARTDADPASADALTATGIESSAQTGASYVATWSSAPNRSSGAAASWGGADASSGTITSPRIDFGWIVGDATDWDEVVIGAVTTNGSITIDILDENDADTGLGCTITGGNASCTVDISSLDPAGDETQISIYASLSDAGGTPFLTDWTVRGGSGEAGALSVDTVDGSGASVGSPSMTLSEATLSLTFQTTTGTLGVSSERIRVSNTTGNASWSLTIAASSTTAFWDGAGADYDFNDPTADAEDGGDADSLGGQMTMDASGGTITPQGGCSATGLTLGSSSAFSQGSTDSITILSASGSAETDCDWDLTGIAISQTIPASQAAGSYSIDMTVTVTAL